MLDAESPAWATKHPSRATSTRSAAGCATRSARRSTTDGLRRRRGSAIDATPKDRSEFGRSGPPPAGAAGVGRLDDPPPHSAPGPVDRDDRPRAGRRVIAVSRDPAKPATRPSATRRLDRSRRGGPRRRPPSTRGTSSSGPSAASPNRAPCPTRNRSMGSPRRGRGRWPPRRMRRLSAWHPGYRRGNGHAASLRCGSRRRSVPGAA